VAQKSEKQRARPTMYAIRAARSRAELAEKRARVINAEADRLASQLAEAKKERDDQVAAANASADRLADAKRQIEYLESGQPAYIRLRLAGGVELTITGGHDRIWTPRGEPMVARAVSGADQVGEKVAGSGSIAESK